MPDVTTKVKAILKSAELSFELGIINATRFGPLIHANIPDYAEILLKVFIEDKTGAVPRDDFLNLVRVVNGLPNPPTPHEFQTTADYFLNTRATFRNPLHHTDRVQGYVIEQREALNCLLKFDDLLKILFPMVSTDPLSELNYPCYIRYLRLEYDESLGRGNHRFYQAVIAELQRLGTEDKFNCPREHDASSLMAVRRLFRYDEGRFTWNVLRYRSILKDKIVALLEAMGRPMTIRQIANALANDRDLGSVNPKEIEACLYYIEGEPIDSKGRVMHVEATYSLVR